MSDCDAMNNNTATSVNLPNNKNVQCQMSRTYTGIADVGVKSLS